MITESSRDATRELWRQLHIEGPYVTQAILLAGMVDTHPGPDGFSGDTTTTALDQVNLLKFLTSPNEEALELPRRNHILELMSRVIVAQRYGVPVGAPFGATWSNKIGFADLDMFAHCERGNYPFATLRNHDVSALVLHARAKQGDTAAEYHTTKEDVLKSFRLSQGLVVGIALTVALLAGTSTSAQATTSSYEDGQFHTSGALSVTAVSGTASPLRLTAMTIDDASLREATYTLTKEQTQNWYLAALAGGVPALTQLCLNVAPGWLKAYCPVFGSIAVALLVANPPNGRCLQAFAKFGWPPVGVRYVTCPSLASSRDVRFGLVARTA